ncbi:MAG: HD family phosphohydrolase [Gammaproteobacteria bacterium]|nr:MAG: HD family phosphohydrolase [Gammaproteobacteria bacterium]
MRDKPLDQPGKSTPAIDIYVSTQAKKVTPMLERLPWSMSFLSIADYDQNPPARAILIMTPDQLQERLKHSTKKQMQQCVILLWLGKKQDVARELLDHPGVLGIINKNIYQDALHTLIKSSTQLLRQFENINSAEVLERVLEVGRALSAEKDLDTLLGLILTHARRITGADGSSIYTLDKSGKLFFRLWQNTSTDARSQAQKTLVGEHSIASYVCKTGELLNIDNAYNIPKDAPYHFNPASDRSLGYHTLSMLTLPLKDKNDKVVGVLQLINRKTDHNTILKTMTDFGRLVLPFDEQSQQIALALAGQAGVAIENGLLYADIENLFEGFIKASVLAIEARDPTTAGHSFRVAEYTENLARAVDHNDSRILKNILFSAEQMREIRYAALLHDFGKVGVRENVLVKAKKLHPQRLELLQQRFCYARACIERDAFRKILALQSEGSLGDKEFSRERKIIEDTLNSECNRLQNYLHMVLTANEPTVSYEEIEHQLNELTEYTFLDEAGKTTTLLHDFEFADLSLSKGSLNPSEREEIESHVSHTFAFLQLIPWTSNLSMLPDIAHAHHEKLDGSGYPRGIVSDEIPVQSKIMTITDIYDALTAGDRPYKKALPMEKAVDILGMEARARKIDKDLLKVFIESKSFQIEQATH